jgi:glycosyltransferase involved in cell wall biosynthesis
MKLKPFFSIIIPALNEELALPLLLQDLADQNFKNFEVILVDGHSDDNTTKQASKFSNKLNLKIINSSKRNVSTQRNLGAKLAKGEYLLFNDADNRLPNYFLEGIKYNLTREPADIFTCWCKADTNKPADKAITTLINIGVEAANLVDYQGALGALIGCRQSTFKSINGFDPTIPFAEDGEFVRRGNKKGYKFTIYKNPHFIFSLRRFRKSGKLRSFQKYAKLHLKTLNQKTIKKDEYPMGGHTFITDQTTQSLLEKIQSAFKSINKKPKLKEKLKSLITIFENNGS